MNQNPSLGKRVGLRAPTYSELIKALRLAHNEHAFGPEHCSPRNCTAAEVLARVAAQGDTRFRIHRVRDDAR